jgi:hypothetical protein
MVPPSRRGEFAVLQPRPYRFNIRGTMPRGRTFQTAKLPREFLLGAQERFSPYTVPLFKYRKEDPNSVRFIGCATLVKCPHRCGLLTARHVIHFPNVPIGDQNTDVTLGLGLSRGDLLPFQCMGLIEHSIGRPISEKMGPDLTFIEIPTGPSLGTLRDRKSFWRIDKKPPLWLDSIRPDTTLLCTMGSPAEYKEQTVAGQHVHISLSESGYFGGYESTDIFEDGGFDFIDTAIEYGTGWNLPQSFGGVSGGGLWAFNVGGDENGSNFTVHDVSFCGVAFYESDLVNQKKAIKHHFFKSVYEVAMRAICDKCAPLNK